MKNYKDINFSELDLDVIIAFISGKCFQELKVLLVFTDDTLNKIISKNIKERNFYVLNQKFKQFRDVMEYQIRKEELILFPFLRQVNQNIQTLDFDNQLIPKLENPLEIVSRDHQKILNYLVVLNKHYVDFIDTNDQLLRLCINGLVDLDNCIKENIYFYEAILYPKILTLNNSQNKIIN